MPLLPRKNNLDYNPDNIIQASKRLATISLEQMKNPIFDPDQATLSSLDAERNLDANMSELGKKVLDIQQLFTTGKNLAFGEATKRAIQYERDERLDEQEAELNRYRAEINRAENMFGDIYGEIGRMRGEGRPKGAKDKSPRKTEGYKGRRPRQNIQLLIEDEAPSQRRDRLTQQQLNTYFNRSPARDAMPSTLVSREPNGRYSVLPIGDYSRRLETTGAVADADDEDPENEDEDYGYNPFTGNRFTGYRWDDGGEYPDDNDDDDDDDDSDGRPRGRDPYGNPDPADLNSEAKDDGTILPQTSLSQVLQLITKKCRDADILLISKIKPALQKLSQQQLQQLTQFYDLLGRGWKDFSISTSKDRQTTISIFTIINKTLQYGDQIIKVLKEELDKLRMDLLVVVNSYKQNEAVAPPIYLPSGDEWAVNPEVRELVESGERLDDNGVPAEIASVSSSGTGAGRRGGRRSKSQPLGIPTIWNTSVRNCPTKYLL